ncbi:MAG: Flp family type IVb pilin [Limnochordia bacterium]|jgi:pilus assembly protein Flp/PilA
MLWRLLKEEEGQGMVEYGLILALIAVGAIAILRGMGTSLQGILNSVSSGLADASGGN